MLTASPSPRLTPSSQSESTGFLSPRSRRRSTKAASPIVRPHSTHVYSNPRYPSSTSTNTPTQPTAFPSKCSPTERRILQPHLVSVRSTGTQTSPTHLSPSQEHQAPPRRPQMVDAQTQYSPPQIQDKGWSSPRPSDPPGAVHTSTATTTPASHISRLRIHETTRDTQSEIQTPVQPTTARLSSTNSTTPLAAPASSTEASPQDPVADAAMPAGPMGTSTIAATATLTPTSTKELGRAEREVTSATPSSSTKRNHSVADARPETLLQDASGTFTPVDPNSTPSSSKKMRPQDPDVKIMPSEYWTADVRDLVFLISSMLMELIRYNDSLTLSTRNLTRFHSRAPPGISVHDYLSRLTTHATLSPPILLSMVYYIDKLCALYPAFTISSLTVHRFLITAATVASKGLSDSFWTNRTYAKVGGVSVKELALLELEFLVRVQWRIVPVPEVLTDYYRSLVGRTVGYVLEGQEENGHDTQMQEPALNVEGGTSSVPAVHATEAMS
ncbi:Pho80p cyclin [Exophiala xenobiotica]|nr:Pho80p cyclin [Exophiala xenobiotica]